MSLPADRPGNLAATRQPAEAAAAAAASVQIDDRENLPRPLSSSAGRPHPLPRQDKTPLLPVHEARLDGRLFAAMTWELSGRRFARSVNSTFLFGRIPLLHFIVFVVEMALVARLTSRFNAFYERKPLVTMMVTNAILFGIADTVAQSLTAIRQRALRKPGGVSKDDTAAIELHRLDKKNVLSEKALIPASGSLPPPFDFERLSRFMAYGFAVAPLTFRWFKFLGAVFPMGKGHGAFVQSMKRVALDQLVFAPFGVALFFVVMTVAEGGGRRAITQKMRDMYVPTLKANYILWPAVQVINFRLMPVQFQLPFVSTIGIAWTAYLSLANAAEETEIYEPESPRLRLA